MHDSTAWLVSILVLVSGVACDRGPKIATANAGTTGVQAVAFNGETYRTRSGESVITLISADELEYTRNGTTFLCNYTQQDDALRVILTTLGTQQVLYFRRVPNGLISNDRDLYLSATGLADVQRQEERERREQQAAQEAQEQQRAEIERQAAVAAQRQAEEQRLADQRDEEQRQKSLHAALTTMESRDCKERQQLVPPKSQLVFVVPPTRECWTPWLVVDKAGSFAGATENGNILMQVVYVDGTTGEPFEDGPAKNITLRKQLQKARFKSLGKEPITITFKVK